MSTENKKVVRNAAIIILFALPCCLIFTGEMFLQFLGVFYTWEFWNNIGKPIQKRYRDVIMKGERNQSA